MIAGEISVCEGFASHRCRLGREASCKVLLPEKCSGPASTLFEEKTHSSVPNGALPPRLSFDRSLEGKKVGQVQRGFRRLEIRETASHTVRETARLVQALETFLLSFCSRRGPATMIHPPLQLGRGISQPTRGCLLAGQRDSCRPSTKIWMPTF